MVREDKSGNDVTSVELVHKQFFPKVTAHRLVVEITFGARNRHTCVLYSMVLSDIAKR
jgi:hypothetical protein